MKSPPHKRNYEAMSISPEDAAYVRSLLIHEDAAVLAFNKPSGLPVQTRNPDDRTLDRLMAAFAKSNGKRPRLVHRLDAQTSGVIIAARTQPAAAALSAAFAGRDMHKHYVALVSGQPMEAAGEIDIPLARHKARPELELMRAARPGDDAQAALTRWRRLASTGQTHLLAVAPETGRMHQIRAHLSLIGRPLLGDPYYGGASTLAGGPVRLMLHAGRLEGPHPGGGRFAYEAPWPEDFAEALRRAGFDLVSLAGGV